jgi:hypothetical protein
MIAGGERNQVGGTDPGEGNVVSASELFGIELTTEYAGDSPDGNVFEGNRIGVAIDGVTPMSNGAAFDGADDGINLVVGDDNVIGGTTAGAGNVIAFNYGDGIDLGSDVSGTRIVGNRIGTDATGTRDLGNVESGVEIDGDDNDVGDPDSALGMNVIAHNGADGVTIGDAGTGNALLRNSILVNDGLGIDLGPDGRNVDDPTDADTGANDLQNAPVPTTAVTNTSTTVTWEIDSLAATELRIEFYSSLGCDPTGFGEGLLRIGARTVTTDGDGHAEWSLVRDPLPSASVVTATATTVVGGAPTSTSEFSECMVMP